ncbi:Ig-like domain-containing protein [Prolixibacteraceae bacterium Z1-6]|uniref:Ig-like domain-containing protein n=1 Tax=Draconibacterium aestuarii TaxID=2998507 RepID=A0A9X3F7C1_9BACT|nr:Ig-like domain-containing protein [Prolixibacteraceae bacterium Z1-6]
MKKLMYIVFFLSLAANLLAQETYVIDSVCLGATRTYRLNGEKGSTYEWKINDSDGVLYASPAYVDFRLDDDPAPGDTIWGSEIDQLWDVVGEYDMVVLHWSVHGCDTVEMGHIKVFPLPEAEAGDDQVICSLDDIVVSGDTARNYSSFYWETTGDGTFSSEYALHPTYYLGANDSLNGSITLVLTAFGLADNETCIPAVDSVTFEFSKPDISFSVKELLCYNDRDAIIRGNIIGGAPPFVFAWTGPDGYTSSASDSITDLGAGWYKLTVTDANSCFDIDSVEIVNPPELTIDDIAVIEIDCYGYSTGAITVLASGGTGSLTYQWRSALGTTYNGNAITDLPADTYYLVVYDENLCTVRDTIVLEEPELLVVNVTAADTILCKGDEVTLHGNPLGGTGELDHRWIGDGSIYLDYRYDSVAVFKNNAPVGTHNLVYIIRDEAGCEASDSIVLHVYPPSESYESIEVCAGADPFPWNNRTILSDADRIYLDTLVGANQYGCDSMLTLDVKVLFPEFYDTTIYVCENLEPYQPYGNITIYPDHDSIYLDTLYYSASRCDSLLITINVFTKPVTYADLDTTLCSGADTFKWNNRWIQTDFSQVYLDTLENIYGCDSLLTYDVTIIPPDTFYVDTTFCQDEPEFVWNGITILTQHDSTYEATLQNQYGCDSLVNLNVQLLPVTDTTIDTLLCYDNPPYSWNNLVIFAQHDSTYLDTLVNQWGCDSLLTLNVEVMYPDTVNIDTTLCEGVPPFAWGVNTIYLVDTYTDSLYTDILQNQFGCDSIVNLDVQILRPAYILDTIEVCENVPVFVWHSMDILTDRDSIYADTLYYAAGCDSLRLQLTLISHPVSDTIIDTVLCEGSPEFAWNSHTISTFTDSTYLDTLSNVWGCDSTLALNVQVVPAVKDTFPATVCYGDPIADWYGQTISSIIDSTYIQLLPDPSGCDTLLYYEVTVLPVTYEVLDTTLCYGLGDFNWNNRLISGSVSGTYLDTLPNSFGCDSLLTYNVIILPPDTTLVYDTLCVGDQEYDWNGYTVSTTAEDVYEASLQTDLGCDSIVILNVTLINGTTTYDTVYACEEYTWTEGTGLTYTVSDDYLFTLDAGAACADSAWLHLVISNPVIEAGSVDVLCNGDSTGFIDLTVSGGIGQVSFLWNTGDTTQNLSDLPAGTYSVTVTDSLGCTKTLDVEIIQPTEILITLDVLTDVLVAGESTGSIEVSVGGGTPGAGYSYQWTDGSGNIVGTDEDLFDVPAGTYTLAVTDANECKTAQTYPIEEPVITPCLEDTLLTCFEDLGSYPLVTSLEDYVTLLKPGQDIDPVCGIDTASFASDFSEVVGSIYCYEELRYYTLLDDCSDTLFHCIQRVIVNDTEAPTMTCPPTIVVTNDVVPPAYADTAEFRADGGLFADNCGVVSFRQVGTDVSDGGSDPEVITRVYEVTDYCGNVATCTQKIEVYLTAEFTIECEGLPDISYECKAELPKYNLAQFRADGGYAYSSPFDIDSFWVSTVSNGQTCPETITRTYYIRNENGDIEGCTKTYVIYDETPPTLILPDKHIYCTEKLPSSYYSPANVINGHVGIPATELMWENCGLSNIEGVVPAKQPDIEPGCPTIITRYYIIWDKCQNRNEATETIYVYDTIPPVVAGNFPYEISDECNIPDPYTDASLYVSDDCGPIDIAYRDSLGGVDEPGVVYRIYRFSDPCNWVEVIQKITIELTNTPVFDDIDPICQFGAAPVLPTTSANGITGYWLPDTVATDVAGDFVFIFYPDSGQCAGPVSMEIEVTPALELSETHVDQGYNPNPVGEIYITVAEGTAPYSFSWSNGATTQNLSGLYAGDYTVYVTDAIGCEDSLTVTITSDDPEFSCPPDTSFECPDVTQYPAFVSITGFIAGGGYYNPVDIVGSLYSFDDTITSGYCLSLERTYVLQDIYGRIDSCTQIIDFYDIVPPVITAPESDTAECLSSVIPNLTTFSEFLAVGGDAYDNCTLDIASFTVVTREPVRSLGQTEVTYVFSIQDICGNIAFDSTTYVSTDFEAPEAVCNSITVYLDENGNYILTEIDMLTIAEGSNDNCTAPEDLTVEVDAVEFTCEDVEEGKKVNVVVTDEAGNSSVCMAEILVVDMVPPTALCKDITVYLDETGQVTVTGAMIDNGSFDNCKLDTVMAIPAQYDCYDVGDNLIKLIAVDVYGLRDTCEATVTVIDPIDPVIVCKPLQTIQLDEYGKYALRWDMVTDSVSDECGIDTVLLDDYELDCENIGTTIITATAYDVNGNSSSCQAQFEVFGNIPPNVVNDSAVTSVDVPVDINVLANDYDLKTNINRATLGVVINPHHGSVVVDNITGIVTYTPDPGYDGPDVFKYTICDDAIPCEEMCGEALVFITVRPANRPPEAVDDYYTLLCGTLTGNVLDNDSDIDDDEIAAHPIPLIGPTNGTVILNTDGSFEYEPFLDFYGIDSFQYEIHDVGVTPTYYDTAWVYITRIADYDCDGVPDVIDIDWDNDGILNWDEGDGLIDSDGDGIADAYDIDSDNDGIPDNIEWQKEDGTYLPPTGRDSDGNGWDDAYDIWDTSNGILGVYYEAVDTDEDGVPDYLDIDSDNDGVFDYIEGHDANFDGIADVFRTYMDSDLDGLDDAYDTQEGWSLPFNSINSNAPLQDFDGDDIRDWRDPNDDGDDFTTRNEDYNQNNDWSDDDLDLDGYPDYLDTEINCELFIPEGFSPNDDGVHDFFQILCIYPRYPNAKMMIFNRNGQKLFEKENYGNYDVWGWNDAWWWGTSENRLTIGRSGGLPAGNYIYVLILNDGLGTVKNGTVMLAY